jgi:hypothetical protein
MRQSGWIAMKRARWILTVLAILAMAGAFTGVVDDQGAAYGERAFKRALVTFAVSRTLNGVISVAQGTEVAVEPGGVGVNFSVGQVLDPVNDLVERFSAVMLVATTSLGMQNVLLRMTSWWGLNLLLGIVAGLAVCLAWWPRRRTEQLARGVMNIFLGLVFARFVVPVLIIGSGLVFDTFLAAEQDAATKALEATSQEIEAYNQQPPTVVAEDPSMLERLTTMLDESLESINVRERLQGFKNRVSNASEHIVNLIVIFVLQTIVFPLAFVWMLLELVKLMGSRLTRH